MVNYKDVYTIIKTQNNICVMYIIFKLYKTKISELYKKY